MSLFETQLGLKGKKLEELKIEFEKVTEEENVYSILFFFYLFINLFLKRNPMN